MERRAVRHRRGKGIEEEVERKDRREEIREVKFRSKTLMKKKIKEKERDESGSWSGMEREKKKNPQATTTTWVLDPLIQPTGTSPEFRTGPLTSWL